MVRTQIFLPVAYLISARGLFIRVFRGLTSFGKPCLLACGTAQERQAQLRSKQIDNMCPQQRACRASTDKGRLQESVRKGPPVVRVGALAWGACMKAAAWAAVIPGEWGAGVGGQRARERERHLLSGKCFPPPPHCSLNTRLPGADCSGWHVGWIQCYWQKGSGLSTQGSDGKWLKVILAVGSGENVKCLQLCLFTEEFSSGLLVCVCVCD